MQQATAHCLRQNKGAPLSRDFESLCVRPFPRSNILAVGIGRKANVRLAMTPLVCSSPYDMNAVDTQLRLDPNVLVLF